MKCLILFVALLTSSCLVSGQNLPDWCQIEASAYSLIPRLSFSGQSAFQYLLNNLASDTYYQVQMFYNGFSDQTKAALFNGLTATQVATLTTAICYYDVVKCNPAMFTCAWQINGRRVLGGLPQANLNVVQSLYQNISSQLPAISHNNYLVNMNSVQVQTLARENDQDAVRALQQLYDWY